MRAIRWYISWRATSVVLFPVALGLKARSVLFFVFRCRGWYELAEIPPLSNTARIIYTFWYHIIAHEQLGDMATFFLQDLGLVLVTKTCPRRPQAIKRAKTVRRFRRKTFFPIFVWTRRLQVLQGMSARKSFHANIRKSDLTMVNLEWNVTQKLDPTLEPSTYKQLPKIRMFSPENSICPRRFIRNGPELLYTCSTCISIPRPYLRGVLFIFAEHIWSHVVRTYTCINVSKKSVES